MTKPSVQAKFFSSDSERNLYENKFRPKPNLQCKAQNNVRAGFSHVRGEIEFENCMAYRRRLFRVSRHLNVSRLRAAALDPALTESAEKQALVKIKFDFHSELEAGL